MRKKKVGFWSQVDRRGRDRCWEWKGRRDGGGYGRYFDGVQDVAAHRVAYGLRAEYPFRRLTHTCGNRACCNPRHMREVSEMPWKPRFWSRVARRGPMECWEWSGARNAGGYGVLHVEGRTLLAHRVGWELAHRRGTSGDVIHTCGNRGCVNPRHLEAGYQHNAWKLDEAAVEDIRWLSATGVPQSRLAAEHRISRSMVSRIVNRTRWQ